MKRIGVACVGDPTDPRLWSGTPAGIVGGLHAVAVEPVALNVKPPGPLAQAAVTAVSVKYLRFDRDRRAVIARAREAARSSVAYGSLQSAYAPAVLGRAGHLDGIIQIGTGYRLRTSVPVVTYEDMTVAQTKTHPYLGWDLLSERTFNRRVRLQQRCYQQARACCVASSWAADSVVEDYGIAAEKVHAIGIGRNLEPNGPVTRDWTVPRFLFVGIDWERKNGAAVVAAFERLRAHHPDAQLDLVGGHPTISAPGVTGHGVLRSDIPDERAQLERLFASATCFVMPSHVEAVGIVYVEAGAWGIPSIGTRNGGAEFLIGDGGIVIDPDDGDELFAAMMRLAQPDEASELGRLATQRSSAFTWETVAGKLVAALDGP